jgi:FtsP/CotA-like multicopper oxidase with cupredoxin domain
MGFGLHTISTHEHNGHNPAESDGYTNAFFFPGQFYDYRWPMILAGHDTINPNATDPRAGAPDGNGGIINIPGDWRETMSTHWFHDHMLDFTAQNVYKGNAVMMNYYSSLDRGNEGLDDGVNLRFPSGTALDWGNRDYDVQLLVADKAWTEDGQLWFNIFNHDGFLGDQLLTNWLFKPFFEVRARRYRFRILNGSVSRYVKLALVDESGNRVPFHMIANDGNVMEHAVAFDGTLGTEVGTLPTQSIAERYDIVVDFANFQPGDKLYFVNLLEHDNGKRPQRAIPLQEVLSGDYEAEVKDGVWERGDPCVGKFLEFRVREYDGTDLSMDPADFVRGKQTMIPLNRPTEEELSKAVRREFKFGRSQGTDSAPWTIKTDGGAGFTMDPRRLTAAPNLNLEADGLPPVEIWHLETGGGWSHPIHIHFEEGQILQRGGETPPEWEQWARKDVYRIGRMDDSTKSVTLAIRFREFAGTYMEHCHNTQHEDHAMLMRWDLEKPGQVSVLPTPIPSWDGCEYVDTVALPTARQSSGAAPNPMGLQIDPGVAGGSNEIRATGTTPGGMTAFLFGFSAGDQTISAGPCTEGVSLGILDLNLLGTDNASGTTSVFSVQVPLEFAGLTVRMQAIDVSSCAPTDVLTHTFSEPVVNAPRANRTRGRRR